MRTSENFVDAITRETSWRKQELTTIRFAVHNARRSHQKITVRAATALLYAHWEGWIKAISVNYVDFLNQQKLRCCDLSDPLLGFALKSRMTELSKAKAPRPHTTFATLIRSGLSAPVNLDVNLVDTESNLSSSVLLNIVDRLGLDSSLYQTEANLIDTRLVAKRNSIAHGEYETLTIEDFDEIYDKVLMMLDAFTSSIENAVIQKSYILETSFPVAHA
ncbi:MAE_28990/MAE_18760 family HEPN-like nuclease [Actinomyces haliotis]|uniref:MAE_28990/MAE_18760 family HEPN-like nuclease n=1 Tax=Actinomyces haliotis TaxID=1280843 RepID=UPI00188F7452|nr:MAE_28990/MAE_18760 family HEPN-like nuclease [Actinomyces haliotis]